MRGHAAAPPSPETVAQTARPASCRRHCRACFGGRLPPTPSRLVAMEDRPAAEHPKTQDQRYADAALASRSPGLPLEAPLRAAPVSPATAGTVTIRFSWKNTGSDRAGRVIARRSMSCTRTNLVHVFAPGGPATGNITIMFQGRRTPPIRGGEATGNVQIPRGAGCGERITRAVMRCCRSGRRSSVPADAG